MKTIGTLRNRNVELAGRAASRLDLKNAYCTNDYDKPRMVKDVVMTINQLGHETYTGIVKIEGKLITVESDSLDGIWENLR